MTKYYTYGAVEFWSNICFYGRCLKVVCQEWWKRMFSLAALAFICGCCNIMERSQGTYTTMGMECGSPYFCAKHPYFCTAAMAKDCLAAPYYWITDSYADWGAALWGAFATLTYPFWVADEVCEIALDTVFMPFDIYAANMKEAK